MPIINIFVHFNLLYCKIYRDFDIIYKKSHMFLARTYDCRVFKSILLFGQSIQGALQSVEMTGKAVKSKQTILNWLKWIGNLHPATILSRAGVKGSGYFHEDEGFEKEAN